MNLTKTIVTFSMIRNCVVLFREYLIKGKMYLSTLHKAINCKFVIFFQLFFVWVVLSDRVYWWPDNCWPAQTVPQGSKDEWSHLIAEEACLTLLFGRMVSQRKFWRMLSVPLVDQYRDFFKQCVYWHRRCSHTYDDHPMHQLQS